jgi:hypothetical protein
MWRSVGTDIGIFGFDRHLAVLEASRAGALAIQRMPAQVGGDEELARLLHGQVLQLEAFLVRSRPELRQVPRTARVAEDGAGWLIRVWAAQ